jgi:4-alpha-glucanotransferase
VTTSHRPLLREALAALGVRRLLLGIHDAAFPSLPHEDVGRGAPTSDGAGEVLAFAADLGFDGLQLGPAGATSRSNPSPYDATLFSRSPLSVALAPLTRPEWGELLAAATLADLVAASPARPRRVAYAYAYDAAERALEEVCAAFRRRRAAGEGGAIADLARRLAAFRTASAGWLVPDALYDVLARAHGGATWTRWPDPLDRVLLAPGAGAEAAAAGRREDLLARAAEAVEDYALVQLLAHAQHDELRARAAALGLSLFGDLQVGMSERDAWAAQAFLLDGFRMGAPPSRTDPAGQAWGFPVLDPRRLGDPGGGDGAALRFVRARARKLLAEYDGVRVDHPHGLVCPWVYRADGDPRAAVRSGARLHESPDLREFPDLAPFAIARPDQLDRSAPRHADGWVTALDEAQVERYARVLDAVLAEARDAHDVAAEILSTMPYPLARVIARHGLGRFRITQKADLDRADDVYRSENAAPADWIMIGNHDTRPIARVVESWIAEGTAPRRAARLAGRLLAPGEDREAWARRTAADPALLAQAMLAELFAGPARHVVIWFTDLLGARAAYNTPGTVTDANWSQRLAPGFAAAYRERAAAGTALNLPAALARAMRARGPAFAAEHAGLAERLYAAARSRR